jgi:K+-transporting ATPase c subunit
LKKLSDAKLDEISEAAVSSAEDYILSRVSKKEIIDIDISVELIYNDELDVDVQVNVIFDDLSSADPRIADEAAEHAIKEIEKILK